MKVTTTAKNNNSRPNKQKKNNFARAARLRVVPHFSSGIVERAKR